jgi:hypothetical protein
MVVDQFEDTGPLTLPGLGGRMFASELRQAQRVAHLVLHRLRKAEEVSLRRAHPVERLLAFRQRASHCHISHFWDRNSSGDGMEPMAGAVWQAFAVILPVRTVGVMGDYRTYAYQVRQLRDMIEEFRLTLEDPS